MKNNKITAILVVIILLLLTSLFIGKSYYQNKLTKKDQLYKSEVLKNDKLVKITETQYRKLVADTLTKKELNKIVDSLEIKLEAKPKVVYQTIIKIKEVEKPVDEIVISNDSINVTDYYPQKENFFAKYENKISLKDSTGIGKFSFNPFNVAVVLSQREDGIWQSDIKVPNFMEVGEVEIKAQPLDKFKPDNFGWLIGGGYAKDFRDNSEELRISGGIRIKKFYILGGATTNQNVDIGINYEF